MKKISALLIVIGIAACSSDKQGTEAYTGPIQLLYQVTEKGVEPYLSRYLITDRYMRIDDGADNTSYTLLDRERRIIYTITHENRRILEIRPTDAEVKSPIKLKMDASKTIDKKAPMINGKQPTRYKLKVNGKTCTTMTVVKGLSPYANAVMREFKRILSTVHANNMKKTPTEMLDICFLAHDVVAPARTYQYGLPIQESLSNGKNRILMDIKKGIQIKPELFEIPKGYKIDRMGGRPESSA
jgi:hypothetical protein